MMRSDKVECCDVLVDVTERVEAAHRGHEVPFATERAAADP